MSTRCWSFSCGAACASQWRHTKGLADVGVVAWGGLDNTFSVAGNMKLRDDSFHNLLLDSSYKWRIGWCCWNKRCPNAGDDGHFVGIKWCIGFNRNGDCMQTTE